MSEGKSRSSRLWAKDITGQRFGRLIVLRRGQLPGGSKSSAWLCRCECGNEKVIRVGDLNAGYSVSCGCKGRENREAQAEAGRTHGMFGTHEYGCWCAMKKRCGNERHVAFDRYGGAGIAVCERWQDSFGNFLADMGKAPSAEHSIERKDNSKGYEPSNCVWGTLVQQARNQKTNRNVEHDGRTQCVAAWAEEFGRPADLVADRLDAGWSIKDALETLPLSHLECGRRAAQKRWG